MLPLKFIYCCLLNVIFVKWSFVLSTTHAKLVDGVTAIKY